MILFALKLQETMPVKMFQASKVLPYPAGFLKDIVADVKQYPAFVPMVKSVDIYPKDPEFFEADLTIGHGAFEKTYRSAVSILTDAVEAKAIPDNTFKYLETRWHFKPLENDHALLDFSVDFKLESIILQATVGKLLSKAAQKMITAFEERAEKLWLSRP